MMELESVSEVKQSGMSATDVPSISLELVVVSFLVLIGYLVSERVKDGKTKNQHNNSTRRR